MFSSPQLCFVTQVCSFITQDDKTYWQLNFLSDFLRLDKAPPQQQPSISTSTTIWFIRVNLLWQKQSGPFKLSPSNIQKHVFFFRLLYSKRYNIKYDHVFWSFTARWIQLDSAFLKQGSSYRLLLMLWRFTLRKPEESYFLSHFFKVI